MNDPAKKEKSKIRIIIIIYDGIEGLVNDLYKLKDDSIWTYVIVLGTLVAGVSQYVDS